MDIWSYLLGLIPAVVTGSVLFYAQRAQKKRDTDSEDHAKARKEEAMLSLELEFATAKLAYATAMAIKRGKANGEVEEGIEAYEKAKERYCKFLNEQAEKYLY